MSHRTQRGITALAIVFTLVIVGVGLAMCQSNHSSPAPTSPASFDAAARAACSQFIQRLARDPGSFDAIEQWNWVTLQNADGTWSVLAHYRAKNGFGGTNVEKTTCVMSRSGDEWQLISSARMK